MSFRLTVTGDTPAEVDQQLLAYLDQRRFTEGEVSPAPKAGADLRDDSPTNDDYRLAIKSIPLGKVASYTVVSEVVRGDPTAPQKVAGLAANDDSLETAYRVIKKDGSIAAGFRWTDGRKGGADEGRRILEEEGVHFDARGRVGSEFMLNAEQLRVYYEGRRQEDES